MAVPGTEVSATDAAGGETITFTTKDQVTELRSRVRDMAAIHNQHHAAGTSPPGMLGGETMSPSQATVIDVQNGSSILLTPSHPGDLQKLQAEVRMRAHRMRLNGCGTMEQARGS
jgi:antitoxin component of MazEF toxin-antitoxin module